MCIRDRHTHVSPTGNLLLPGNLFEAPIPAWTATKISFLYYTSAWAAWQPAIVVGAAGLVLLGVMLLAVHLGNDSTECALGAELHVAVQEQARCEMVLALW
eukprot:TRINITY_DN38768_c0_g1_i1.p2 TRINITY_DN38768_c0_g1~~TRINITY_DN38768_c0_g1_i1.p2  ORF type:complete len:101 (-),score=15.12 TRINITY_DN38768_c0_g1_i1:32-334(-)